MNMAAAELGSHSRMYWVGHSVLLLLLALVIGWDIVVDSGEPDRTATRLLLSETDIAAGLLESGVSSVEELFAAVEQAVGEAPRSELEGYLNLLVQSRQDVVSISVSGDFVRTDSAPVQNSPGATVFTRGRSAQVPYDISIVLAPEFWARRLAPVIMAEKDTRVAVVAANGRSVLPAGGSGLAFSSLLAAAARDPQLNGKAQLQLFFHEGAEYNLALRKVIAPLLKGGPLAVGLFSARTSISFGHHPLSLVLALAWLVVAVASTLVLAKELRARGSVEASAQKMRHESSTRENFINVVMENASVMVAYWDMAQRCRYANSMYRSWFGKTVEQITGQYARDILGEALYALCGPLIEATLRGEPQTFEQERPRKDGSKGYVFSRYIPDWEEGVIRGFFVIASDVTELKETQLQLEKRVDDLYAMATTDALTGLNNRRNLLEKVQFEMDLSQRLDMQISFMMLDIDHFKRINDTFGHDGGDAVLRRLGLLLRQTLRTVDHSGRLGGEEFGVLLTGSGPEEAYVVAERLRKEVMELAVEHGGETMRFTISIGLVSLASATGNSVEVMMKKADTALYQAKNSGRNRVCVAEYGGEE